ncbi:DUF1016 family protein [bacterium]|nr:DUF1016 family protein [bacterium]
MDYISKAVSIIKASILKSQANTLRETNRTLLLLYYEIGGYVSTNSRKGTWGTGAISAISERLQKEMPGLRGFGERNIKNMRIFYEFWSPFLNRQPVAADLGNTDLIRINVEEKDAYLNKKLDNFFSISFSLHLEIITKVKSFEECIYYIAQAKSGAWTKRELRNHLKADDYQHSGKIANNFAESIPCKNYSLAAIRMFKDEYLLDFVNVEDIDALSKEDVDERMIEHSIMDNIKKFIMTFGKDFSFISNQYRMEIKGHEMFIDLLFFNRELNSLVAVELKRGEFKPAYLGQMNLYLQVLEDLHKKEHENPPIGIILCKSVDKAFVEYAVRDYNKPMGVAIYKTADEMPEKLRATLPSITELRKQLESEL